MAIPHVRRLTRLLVFVVGAMWVGAGCTSYPSPSAEPAYDTDVRPIFLAHCTRCHGDGPDGGSRRSAAGTQDSKLAPPTACFTQFGPTNVPDGGTAPGCVLGAAAPTTTLGASEPELIQTYIHSTVMGLQMPPPPAAPLNSYELGVIDAWVAENPLKCSDSPNPDPALNCTAGSYP